MATRKIFAHLMLVGIDDDMVNFNNIIAPLLFDDENISEEDFKKNYEAETDEFYSWCEPQYSDKCEEKYKNWRTRNSEKIKDAQHKISAKD